MRSINSRVLMPLCLLGLALTSSGCATGIDIPDSLKAPCESTVDVSQAQTIGDLGKAIVQGDGDLRVCDVRREAVVAIAEARVRPWWRFGL